MRRTLIWCCFILAGCTRMEDLKKNPNKATQAPPAVVFSGVAQRMFESPWEYAQRSAQYHCQTYSYYGDQSYSFGEASYSFVALRNIAQLEKEATRVGGDAMRPYFALANFMKAWFYIRMSAQVGDIPMSEAMKVQEGIDRPVYDEQRLVYQQCLQLLQQAHDTLALLNNRGGYTLDGDFYFRGNLRQWQKIVNAFRLRVLMSMSKRVDDPGMRIREMFATVMQLPLPESNADNLQIVYSKGEVSNYYPAYTQTPEVDAKRSPLGATYINLLKTFRDPRLFIVALPAAADNTGAPRDFDAYRGAATGTLQSALNDSASKGLFSIPNYNYWFSSPDGHPNILLGYPEVNFTIAEAINRGWISGYDAAVRYREGIRSAMKEYDLPTDSIEAYLQQSSVQYQGNNAAGLQQILQQKYLAFFQHAGWEPFLNQRRTGIPAFSTGPATQNSGRIPLRWTYPSAESVDNPAHLADALRRQYNGADDINGVMWLLK